MAYNILNGKDFVWWHFSSFDDTDLELLQKQFKFHALDFDDLREESELTKLDTYKHYLFCVFNLPQYDGRVGKVVKMNFGLFIGKDYVVTISRTPVEAIDRFFARAQRSSGLRRDALGATTGHFVYKLIEYVLRDVKVALRELVRETELVEASVYDKHTRVTTKLLGMLRRNVLFMRHMIEPHKMIIDHLKAVERTYMPPALDIYFDDLKDSVVSVCIVLENLTSIVDGLFDVNEAFLSHRTNDSVRFLTIISVVLMPPMLITSYYGMNVIGLPLAHNIVAVTAIVLLSLLCFVLWVLRVDKRR